MRYWGTGRQTSRLIGNTWSRMSPRILRRLYGTRTEDEFPIELLRRPNRPWFSFKVTGLFFAVGALLAYNEVLFEVYKDYTSLSEDPVLVAKQLEFRLKNLPLYEKLAHPKADEKWVQLRSWENFDRNVLEKSDQVQNKLKKGVIFQKEYTQAVLTNSTLKQPGGIAVEPAIFFNPDTNETVTFVHVGYRLCGYPLLVHGGIIATLLNETFKRNASLCGQLKSQLKGDFKVDNLSISYKLPSMANQFLVIRTLPMEVSDERRAVLSSVVQSEAGKTLVKAEASVTDTGRELQWWKRS